MRHVTAPELPPRQPTRLGRTSPALAAGCWPLAGPCVNDGADVGWAPTHDIMALDALRAAWERGLLLFDTADVYGHGRGEERLGYLLAEVPRDQVIVSTKTGYDRRSGHPYQALQMTRHLRRSLTRLGTDYVDIYAYHSTDFGSNDQYLAEAIVQMHEFKREGLIRAIAIRAPHEFATQWADESNPRGKQARRFLHLLDRCQPDLIAVRHNLLSPAYRTDESTVIDLARQRGIDLLIKVTHHRPPHHDSRIGFGFLATDWPANPATPNPTNAPNSPGSHQTSYPTQPCPTPPRSSASTKRNNPSPCTTGKGLATEVRPGCSRRAAIGPGGRARPRPADRARHGLVRMPVIWSMPRSRVRTDCCVTT